MAVSGTSDLLGFGPDTQITNTTSQTAATRRSGPRSTTEDAMPERRASEQLWRDEYAEEGPPASDDLHAEISVDKKSMSISSERPSSMPSMSPTKRSSHKPQFRIVLPPATTIPGVSHDSLFDHPLPLLNHSILTPPEDIPQPSWVYPSSSHHESSTTELTPPLDMDPCESGFISSEPEVVTAPGSTQDASDVFAASIQLAVQKMIVDSSSPKTIRVVHQLAPSPIDQGHEAKPVSGLKAILNQIQPQDSSNAHWVLVTHAIPEKYPLKNITGSPATTPQGFLGSDDRQDYFSVQRVVHNAIVLPDRHDLASSHSLTGPQPPALASTPYSIDLSLYQRIIPPATSKEVRDLFDVGTPSALVDRLTELVPSGRLIFVYPTQAGARTFEGDYLDKALAPITRRVVFGKGLPAEACSALASSGSAAAIPDFDTMKSQVTALLSSMASADGGWSRSSWSILSSGTQGITLPHKVWKDWWSMQEMPRVRAIMDYYFRQVSRQHGFYRDERFTANELARQIIQDLGQLADDENTPPPIEVAVFVIERTS